MKNITMSVHWAGATSALTPWSTAPGRVEGGADPNERLFRDEAAICRASGPTLARKKDLLREALIGYQGNGFSVALKQKAGLLVGMMPCWQQGATFCAPEEKRGLRNMPNPAPSVYIGGFYQISFVMTVFCYWV